MNRQEHVLLCVGEEGSEVAGRVSKALRFGLGEVEPDQPHDNAWRIALEVYDVLGAYQFAVDEGLLPPLDLSPDFLRINAARKRAKIERFMQIGRDQGVLTDERP